ncbi:Plasmodium exported protein (PHISTc), unknown function [Plasmodium sp. gorilla clade G2]|uniref:Plasmodium exported protein (PHISTc), unknown function n=1 Tax=Plasmodium sp. gorilla clade G2 TaxID=880535 RepID=UPI000D27734D|nr:Plasmodium exported protein (PHISTc), unknown function [Plasmodium sp. gorilla clade G2]SOV20089.1 Plasmodium exported protein (PHISTc), unknown function [Plasmodium sp. gorilla clade G2]
MIGQISSSLKFQRTKIIAEGKDSFNCRKSCSSNREMRKEKSPIMFFSSYSRLSIFWLLCIFLLNFYIYNGNCNIIEEGKNCHKRKLSELIDLKNGFLRRDGNKTDIKDESTQTDAVSKSNNVADDYNSYNEFNIKDELEDIFKSIGLSGFHEKYYDLTKQWSDEKIEEVMNSLEDIPNKLDLLTIWMQVRGSEKLKMHNMSYGLRILYKELINKYNIPMESCTHVWLNSYYDITNSHLYREHENNINFLDLTTKEILTREDFIDFIKDTKNKFNKLRNELRETISKDLINALTPKHVE